MTALVILWLLITGLWAIAMLCAARLWTLEGRTAQARYAIAGVLTAWAWPAFLIITITWYLIYRKRLP